MRGCRAVARAAAFFMIAVGSPLVQAQSQPCAGCERVELAPDGARVPDAWRNVGRLDVTAAVDSAAYFVIETLRSLHLFSRFGLAPGQVDVTQQPLQGLVVADDAVTRTINDYVISYADHEQQRQADMPDFRRKYAWQLTYRSDAPGGLAPASDVQLDRFPGMNITLDDAWVVGLRFEMDYGWTR